MSEARSPVLRTGFRHPENARRRSAVHPGPPRSTARNVGLFEKSPCRRPQRRGIVCHWFPGPNRAPPGFDHVAPAEHPVRLALRGAAVGVAVALDLSASAARSAQVSNLAAKHASGQTFITWTCPPGPGWVYRVYASAFPIRSTTDLNHALRAGAASDSSWYDRRYSLLTGATTSYRIDSLAAPLGPDQGLCVLTVDGRGMPYYTGKAYYAVTAQLGPTGL